MNSSICGRLSSESVNKLYVNMIGISLLDRIVVQKYTNLDIHDSSLRKLFFFFTFSKGIYLPSDCYSFGH